MADNNGGTSSQAGQAPATDPAATSDPKAGTGQVVDEVTTLKSRNAGLDAKVTTLLESEKAAIARAEAAEARALELAAGKDNGDAELRAQLKARETELDTARREALLARIEAKYPETYAVLGEAAANLSADKLAEAEARFKGVAGETSAPVKPVGNNPSRTQGGASEATVIGPEGETLEQMRARVYKLRPPWAAE